MRVGVVVLGFVSSAWAQVTPLGGEFQVNVTGAVSGPKLSANPTGAFVVSWASNGVDGNGSAAMARTFNRIGAASTSPLVLNTYTTGNQAVPSIAMAPDGSFVAAWSGAGPGDTAGIFWRRVDASGVPQGSELLVNSSTPNVQQWPRVSIAPGGDFVVVWNSAGSSYEVFAHRYDSAGNSLGEFMVNSYTTGYQYLPDVVVNDDSSFDVVWHDDTRRLINVNRYDSAGGRVGGELISNTGAGRPIVPQIGGPGNGTFVTAWAEDDSDGDQYGIMMRRYDSTGTPAGDPQLVNVNTAGWQLQSSIDANASGDFVIAWYTDGAYGGDGRARFRAYQPDGTPRGGDLLPSTTPVDVERNTDVALNDQGEFVVAWSDGTTIMARRFSLDPLVPVQASIGDVTVTEGNLGSTAATFTVTLSSAPITDVSVGYGTGAAGTATSGTDYQPRTGIFIIPAGQTSATATVFVYTDTLDEANEIFYVNLSDPSANLSIEDGQARATIIDDDALPSISFSGGPLGDGDKSYTEGDTANVTSAFNVKLSAPSGRVVKVNYATGTGGTATSGVDYQPRSGTLTWNPGETLKSFSGPIYPDTIEEIDEAYYVNLSAAVNASIADVQATGTIQDNDPPPAGSPTVNVSDAVAVVEGSAGTVNAVFTITLTAASANTITVPYTTGTGGTATSGVDYAIKRGTLTFTPGQTSKTINVQVNGDLVDEPNETFFFNLSSAAYAFLGDKQGQGTITDDDPLALTR